MGFMDYTLVGSDEAAMMTSSIFKVQLKKLKSELRRRTNQYNTPGYMNVAMFIREVLQRQVVHLKVWDAKGYRELAALCVQRLEMEQAHLNKMTTDNSKDAKWLRDCKSEVKRMIKSVEKFRESLGKGP